MVNQRLYGRLRLLAEEEFGIPSEQFSLDAKLAEEPLSFDPLMVVELMFTIEEEFREADIEFDDKRFKECKTFGDVVNITEEALTGKDEKTAEAFKRQVAERREDGEDIAKWVEGEDVEETVSKPRQRATHQKRKPRCAVKKTEEKVVVAEKKQDPIRKNQVQTRGRHGRYFRRESTVALPDKEGGKGSVQLKEDTRPDVGSEGRQGSEVATRDDERHQMEDRETKTSA